MRSLGRVLHKVGERSEGGPSGARRTLLFTSLPPRSPLARFLRRAATVRLPRHAGKFASAGFLACSVLYGAVLGGHLPAVRAAVGDAVGYVTAGAGLAIESVSISGHSQTGERDIVAALGITESTSLVTFDPHAARERLAELPWVEAATVRKVFPNALRVEVSERDAFALWQIGGIVSLIDESGVTIDRFRDERFANLPLVAGYGANRGARELIDMIRPHPRLATRFRAAVRVAERRWNLILDNGMEVRLPEHGPAAAIARIERLDEADKILSRDVAIIDARFDDRLVVRLREDAAKRLGLASTGERRGNS